MSNVHRRDFLTRSSAAVTAMSFGAPVMARQSHPDPVPPRAPKRPVRLERHGRVRYDDYAWIKHPNWFSRLNTPDVLDPEIRRLIEDENLYCDAVLAPTQGLQAELVAELERRVADNDATPPTPDGPWLYYSVTRPGAEHPRYCRRPRNGGAEQLLLDVEAEAEAKTYYRITGMRAPHHSPDHRYFAWMADDVGDERFKLRILDLETGEEQGETIGHGYGQFEFSTDSRWIYWVHRDAMSRPVRVLRRLVRGGPVETVIEESDPGFFLGLQRTPSNAWLLITSSNPEANEVHLVSGGAAPRLVEPRTHGLRYTLHHWGDRFVIQTNADGAIDYKLMTAPEDAPGRDAWREWIPHRPGRHITAVRAFRDHLARVEWIDANPVLVIIDREGGERVVRGREDAYLLNLAGQQEYASAQVRYTYASPITPRETRSVDMGGGEDVLVQRQETPWFDSARYRVRRLAASAPDGAQVPLTLITRADLPDAPDAPAYIACYGAYGSSTQAGFSIPRLSLVDRGWVVVLAHTRGGSERGARWALDARGLNKRNTITDLIACADHLAAQGLSRAGRMVAHSYSAGGIPIGGAMNLRPELWAGMIAQVPFVDVLNSIQDEDNPLLYIEYPEWGDPADPEIFDYVAGYSPYENVIGQAYPSLLATAGLLDDRVGYWEAAKWVARLREHTTSDRPLLLKTYMNAGHQGDTGRLAEHQRNALHFAYSIWATGGLSGAG